MKGTAPTRTIALILLSVGVLVSVYCGWRLFWFLTDDSFIDYRYISNSHLGLGYVWNAPPFRPVEGYTSFLWVVLLDFIWRVTGVEPPDAANYVSLIFAYLTLLTGALMVLKMSLREELETHRVLFLALILTGVISNRTFLAWTSSGLEAGMFNFFFTLWIYCCLFLPAYSRRWLLGITGSAALVYLSRPDGLLIAFVTLVLIGKALSTRAREAKLTVSHFVLSAPLLLIPAHLLWRHAFYGAWLPNTYYAKTVAGRIWPAAGIRYFLSFAMEYSLWVWLIALVAPITIKIGRLRLSDVWAEISLTKVAVVFTVVAHFLYYTLVIGGDHFEYRVYSHLILLIFISFLWMLNAMRTNAKRAALLFCAFIILSWPIPWIHWTASHNLQSRKRTITMKTSVADAVSKKFPSVPNFMLSYLRVFDRTQFWLIDHSVCRRHQEHKVFHLVLRDHLPTRAEGMALSGPGYPVLAVGAVGMISWVLPKINVIDTLGLNDYVVARNPDTLTDVQMAHERQPPAGYVECFDPNVTVNGKQVTIKQRESDLTAKKIAECEQRYTVLMQRLSELGAPAKALLPVRNPIDEPQFFIRQHYLDVLNRPPDPQGLGFWLDQLSLCGTSNSLCRSDISRAFFDAGEFRQRGFFVHCLYRASFGTAPRFSDFMQDLTKLEDYDVDEIEKEQGFLLREWINRDSFRQTYPDTMTPEEFVNRLFDSAGLHPFVAERRQEIEAMRAGRTRAEVLKNVISTEEFKRGGRDPAFILTQYFIQLRRDAGEDEYKFLSERLKRDGEQGYRTVTCLLITSPDYQLRFGSVVTRSNEECGR
jgi:arabinofuranosyltransferase